MIENGDLQSWSEVPSIAHFCSLFRQAFDLLEFDIQELEESLLLMGSEDDTLQLVPRLVIKLLKGISPHYTRNMTTDNYNNYLRRLMMTKREEAEEDHLPYSFDYCKTMIDDDIDFHELSLRKRVLILSQLCEFRLDADDCFEKVKNLDADSLRVDPLGKDSEGITYWYFYGTRLYREDPPISKAEEKKRRKEREKEKEKKKKKKDKKDKKKKKKSRHRDSCSSNEDDDTELKPRWGVACLTLNDWEELAEKYKASKKKTDKELYETIAESFLPEIKKMFAEKEREEKRRMLMLAPKRLSTRLEKKRKEQEDKDKERLEKFQEQRHLEEEYDEKLRIERKARDDDLGLTREERQKNREMMKELRAKRAAERAVEKEFTTDVIEQRAQMRGGKKEESGRSSKRESSEQLSPVRASRSSARTGYDSSKEESDDESKDSTYNPPKPVPPGQIQRTNFTNALLKAGTKSTKDSSLDKPVRKSPGFLLETAGRSLMQKKTGGMLGGAHGKLDSSSTAFDSLLNSSGGSSTKLSFGLYGGHLPVDHGGYTKPLGGEEGSELGGVGGAAEEKPVRKVFSNWGGEFFRKNLDYRANTNKILEKMNLTVKDGSAAPPSAAVKKETNGFGESSAPSSSGSAFKHIVSSFSVKRPAGGGDQASSNSNSSSESGPAAKKLKASFLSSSFVR